MSRFMKICPVFCNFIECKKITECWPELKQSVSDTEKELEKIVRRMKTNEKD